MAGEGRKEAMAYIEALSKGIDEQNAFAEEKTLSIEHARIAESIEVEEETAPPAGTPEAEHADLEKLSRERLKEARREQREQERVSRGMRALQKEEAREAERERIRQAKETEAKAQGIGLVTSAVGDAVSGPVDMVKNAGSDTARVLESVSTPGSILLPVMIVIVLFLALIPVNGYPRLAWLWFVITGNASLTGTGGTTGSPVEPPPENTQASTGQPETQAIIAQRQLVQHYQYTGVEEIE